ncbi:12052_t:CDS:2, partial [Acaulospora colombiana]
HCAAMMSSFANKKDWFKFAIENGFIKSFEYNSFENKNKRKMVALKSLHKNNDFHKDFVREVRVHGDILNHDDILTRNALQLDSETKSFFLVLQYANGGTLRSYLQKNFDKLNWPRKLKMAVDIANGLNCIHGEVYNFSCMEQDIIEPMRDMPNEADSISIPTESITSNLSFQGTQILTDPYKFAKEKIFVTNVKPTRTCTKMLKLARESLDNDFDESNDKPHCVAWVHVSLGDVEGLKWHLDYDDHRDIKILPEFTIKFCCWDKIILVFETLKLYGANFGGIHLSLGSLVKNNSVHFPRELLQFKELLIWLLDNNCDINELKDSRGFYSLYDLLDALGLHKHREVIDLYLEFHFNPNNSYNTHLPNLLFYSVSKKFPLSTLKLILNYGIDLSTKNSEGLNVLDYAANEKSIETLEYLLRRYSKTLSSQFKFSEHHPNLLFLAIKKDFPISTLGLILDSGVDLLTKNVEGLNVLDYAAEEKNLEALEYLLSNCSTKLNSDHRFSKNCPNLLFLAIKENYPISTLRLILNSRVKLSIKNHDGLNAINYAAVCKNIEALEYLLSNYSEESTFQHRFSQNCPNLLFLAIENFFPVHILELILNSDIDLSTKNDMGLDALDYADIKKDVEALEHLLGNYTKELNLHKRFSPSCPNLLFYSISRRFPTSTLEVILTSHDIDLSTRNASGLNVLNYSVYERNIEALEHLLKFHSKGKFPIPTLKLILESGVDLSAKNDEGLNALEYAADNKNIEALEFLLGFFKRLDSNSKPFPPCPSLLFFAIRNEFPVSTLKLILGSGVDLLTKNDEGQNILDYSALWKNIKALEYLLKNHATELNSHFMFSEECPNLIFLAIKKFPVSTLSLALDLDIDLSIKNRDNLNAFDYVLNIGIMEKIECFIENQNALNFRFSPDCPNLLFYTLYKKYPISIVKLIRKHGVDYKTKNNDELNALGYAVKLKNMVAVRYLLENILEFSEQQSIAEAIGQTKFFSREWYYLQDWK